MIPDVVLVTAAVVTTTVALVFTVWSFRAYEDFKRSRMTQKLIGETFPAIRAGALDSSGRPLFDDLDVKGIVNLLYEMRSVNLADVPKIVIARTRKLASRK